MAAPSAIVAGTYNLSGGTLAVSASLAAGSAGNYAFNLAGGYLQFASSISSPLKMAISGTASTIDTQGNLDALSGKLSGNGGFTQAGPGHLTLTGANTYLGQTTVSAGTLELGTNAQAPVLTGGGANIEASQIVFDYPDKALTISGLLAASYNGGLWNVGQFQCTTEDATHGLGWMDTGTNVTVMYTLYGDANLDGTVNGNDLNTVLSNFNQTGMTWSQGDFNYDGTVNGADLNTVLSNFNQHLSVVGAVPEPSTLLLAAAGLAGLLAYAWRKRK